MDILKKIDAPMKVVQDTVLKLLICLMVYNFIQFDVKIFSIPLFSRNSFTVHYKAAKFLTKVVVSWENKLVVFKLSHYIPW